MEKIVDKERKKLISYWIALALLGLFIVIVGRNVVSDLLYNNEINRHAKYTIGITDKRYRSEGRKPRVSFHFAINGTRYSGSVVDEAGEVKCPAKRYIIVYSSNDPTYNTLFKEYPVPDSIIAPENGWDSIPRIKR